MRLVWLAILAIVVIAAGCGRSQPAPYDPAELAAFKEQTGLTVPDTAEILGYSSGWDERFLKLRMKRADVKAFIAAYPVQMVSSLPTLGMAKDLPAWWNPKDVKPFNAYYGQFTWKTNSLGAVSIVVEGGDSPRPLVYVYVFKT